MKSFDKNETGELIAAIHSLSKDKVRELALLMWQYIHALDAANSPEIPNGWVSCDERMPAIETAVLVACEFDGDGDWRMKWGTLVPSHPYAIEGWLIPGASWIPTHWMPLPAPPKQEE